MPTRVKKDRRASGVKFSKAPKVPTPLEDRKEFRTMVRQPRGLRQAGQMVPRSEKQLEKARKAWGISQGGDDK